MERTRPNRYPHGGCVLSIDYANESSLGRQIFGNTPLGDYRRTERLVVAFDQMCKHPGDSLPAKMADPPQLRALYRLCNYPQTRHSVLVEAARGLRCKHLSFIHKLFL